MSNSLVEKSKANLPDAICLAIFFSPLLYYIYYLENEKCRCIKTWHHYYIKYYIFAYILYTIFFGLPDKILIKGNKNRNERILMSFLAFAMIILLYSLYVYVDKLNKTQCACAVHDRKYINNVLYYLRYIMMAFAIIHTIYLIILVISLL